jgi:hypothetical protein
MGEGDSAVSEHWIVEALDRAQMSDTGILAEGDDGRLYVPSRTRADYWDRRYQAWNPLHWRYWIKSRLTRKVAMVEMVTSDA